LKVNKSTNKNGRLEIGVIYGPGGHIHGGTAASINGVDRTRFTNMQVTMGWSFRKDVAEEVAKKAGFTVVKHFDDMVGKVDGLMIDDFYALPFVHKLAKPYFESKIPIYFNRPFINSLPKARSIIESAKKFGVPIMTGTWYEFTQEAAIIRNHVKNLGKDITGYCAHNATGHFYTHGIHGLNWVHKCICQGFEGGKVRAISFEADSLDGPNGIITLEHEGRDGGEPFYGCLHENSPGRSRVWIKIYSPKETFEHSIFKGLDIRWGWEWSHDIVWALPLELSMQRMFETGDMPESYDDIYHKTELFIGAFKSFKEHGGRTVALTDIGDWDAGIPTREEFGSRAYSEAEIKEWERMF
jgi:hypothetical protein